MEQEVLDLNIYRFNQERFDNDANNIDKTPSVLDVDWAYYLSKKTTSSEKILDRLSMGKNPMMNNIEYTFYVIKDDVLFLYGYNGTINDIINYRLYSVREIIKRDKALNEYAKFPKYHNFITFKGSQYDELYRILNRQDRENKLEILLNE